MSTGSRLPDWIQELAEGIREEWLWLVTGQLLVGLALVLMGLVGWLPAKGLAGFVGCFLLVYATLILFQHRQVDLFGDRLQRRLHAAISSSGVGFYGIACVSRFLQLELHDLLEAVAEFEVSRQQVMGMLRDLLIGFSVQSLMNSIQSFIWPVQVFASYGVFKALLVLGPLWLLYRFGAWLYPAMHREIEKDEVPDLDEFEDADEAHAPPKPPPPPRA